MSIVASVKVYDGLVLAADSASTIFGKDAQGNIGVVKTYMNAKKLFQLENQKIGIATYGTGNIGKRSIESYLQEYMDELKKTQSVQDLSQELLELLRERYNEVFGREPEQRRPALGIFVGGYSSETPFAQEWEFIFPRDSQVRRVRPNDQYGASWRGVSRPFTRLHKGFDPRIKNKLRSLGVEQEIIDQALSGFECPVAYDGMPLQDAVNFVHYIISTTIGFATFELGPPPCGGPIDIAAITPTQFKWVQGKEVGPPRYEGGTQ